jgi:hypothetical protein
VRAAKKNKQKSIKTIVDGITFQSRKEARRYLDLKLLLRAGKIKDLILQPQFPLIHPFVYRGKKIRGVRYIADFQYFDVEKNQTIVEDVKSEYTSKKNKDYIIKKKLLLSLNPDINFHEFI